MDANQFRKYVIYDSLILVGLYSEQAEEQLIGTAAQESHLGEYIKQLGGGPALGVFQMEPATHEDIFLHFLSRKPDLSSRVLPYVDKDPNRMITDLRHAVIMARLQYYRRPEPLPDVDDLDGQAKYWKQWYNTPEGEGTVQQYKQRYHKYCKGD